MIVDFLAGLSSPFISDPDPRKKSPSTISRSRSLASSVERGTVEAGGSRVSKAACGREWA
jgi:hypothetical protein